MRYHILLIEDSKETYQMVNQAVSQFASLKWITRYQEALDLGNLAQYDLVLLDIGLPDGSGFDLCNDFQQRYPQIPVFILSGHTELSEKVLGFSAGADDYITKPFNILELKARIEAKLKKQSMLLSNLDVLEWQEIKIYKSSQKVEVLEDETFKKIELTALEFKLLVYLATRPQVAISREDILNDIWGEDIHVYSRSVDTHISKLRKKIEPASHVIESVHGVGYKFVPTAP